MEDSWNYDCAVGNDARAISQEDWQRSRLMARLIDRTVEGVVYTKHSSYSGLLAPSNPSGNTVRIASGAAVVNGFEYYSDANVDFDVSGGNANATDLIVLRSTPASGLVRLALVRGPGGGAAAVTQNATTWEIALAQVLLDGSGDFSALTDVRRPAHAGHVLIERKLLAADGAIDFTGIPSLFTHLYLVGQLRSANGAVISEAVRIQFNGDTGNNYDWFQQGFDTSAPIGASALAGQANILIGNVTAAGGTTTNDGDTVVIHIPGYKNTTLQKSLRSTVTLKGNNTTSNWALYEVMAWWRSTVAINRVNLSVVGNFKAGSVMSLYGVV